MKKLTLLAFVMALFVSPSFAQEHEEGPSQAEIEEFNRQIDEKVSQLKYETGTITLGDSLATVEIPAGYKFLNAEDSRFILETYWGNPEDSSVLGMLFLKDQSPASENFTYAVVYSFVEDGHVDDQDAASIDYDDLLSDMQAEAKEAGKELREQGYAAYELVGWASAPFYDAENKKLHWAKELSFEGTQTNTLNYEVRILGREGVLSMNILGDINVLSEVKKDMPQILASTNFNEGHRYSDFDPEVDKIAAYGIGALVAGKLLSKVGIFAFLLKYIKVIGVVVVAAGAAAKKFLFGSKSE